MGGTTERDSIAQSSGCLCFWASGGSKHPKRLGKRRGAKEQIWETSWLEGTGSDEQCHFEQQLRQMETRNKPRISARKPTKSFGFLSSCGFRAMMEPSRLNIFTVLVILNQSRLILIKTYSSDRINSSNIAISKRIVPRGLNHLEPNKEKRSMAYHIIDGF